MKTGSILVLLLLLFPSRGERMLALNSKYKLTRLILWIGYPFCHLPSYRKSNLIHKFLTWYSLDNKEFMLKCFNIAKCLNQFWQTSVTNFSQKNWVPWVEVSPRVMITRFQDPLKVFGLIGHSWNLKTTDFWGS